MLAPLLAFIAALFILLRQEFLYDADPYLHLAMAKYVSAHGFPSKIPYIEIMGSEDFNYLSEKWIFIYLISFFYKIQLSDMLLAKYFIAAIFAGIVGLAAKILEELKVKPAYALLVFAFPFQLLLKLRPEPLSILLMLALVLILLKRINPQLKIFLASLVILIHSQEHAFFAIDVAILALYCIVYRERAVFLSLLSLPIALLINPYGSLWLSSLYLDVVPRLYFSPSPLMPTELMKPGIFELGFFFAVYAASFYGLRAWESKETKFIFAIAGILLISSLLLIRMVTYASVFLTIITALYISKSPTKLLSYIVFPLAVMNPLATFFYPGMMPDYDEGLQLEVLKEIESEDVVLSTWDLSPFVVYYTGAAVVTAGDVYYIWLYSKELHRSYEEVFSGNKNAINKFNASLMYFDKKKFNALYLNIKSDEKFRLLAENERFAVFRVFLEYME